MNKKYSIAIRLLAISIVTGMCGEHLFSQTESVPEDLSELPSFVVNQTSDDGWSATTSMSVLRFDAPIEELPINVYAITQQQMEDMGSYNILQALGTISPGIAPQNNADPFGVNRITVRGFGLTEILRNGFPISKTTDSFNMVRVDVVKGPSGMINSILTGAGGSINYLTIVPRMERTFGNIDFTIGSYGFYRTTLDYNTPINDKVAFRLAGAYQEWDYWQRNSKSKIAAINPTLLFRPFKGTEVIMEYEYSDRDRPALRGDTSVLRVPPQTGGPSRIPIWAFDGVEGIDNPWWSVRGPDNRVLETIEDIRIELNQNLGKRTKLNFAYFKVRESGFREQYPQRNNTLSYNDLGVPERINFRVRQDFDNSTIEQFRVQVVSDFNILDSHHRLLVGARWVDGDRKNKNVEAKNEANSPFEFTVDITPDILVQPPSDIRYLNRGGRAHDIFRERDEAVYFVNLHSKYFNEKLITLFGFQSVDLDDKVTYFNSTDPETGLIPEVEKIPNSDNVFLAGAIWQLFDKKIGIFGQYSEALRPNTAAGTTEDGSVLPPIGAQSSEFGMRWNSFNGKLTGTVSYYKIKEKNVPVFNPFIILPGDDPEDPTGAWEVIEGTKSEGWEVDGFFLPTKNWQINFGYAYNKAYDANDPEKIPLRFNFKDSWAFGSRYHVDKGFLEGTSFGFNYKFVGERFFRFRNGFPETLPSDEQLTAFITYLLKLGDDYEVRFSLRGKNLLEQTVPTGRELIGEKWNSFELKAPREFYFNIDIRF